MQSSVRSHLLPAVVLGLLAMLLPLVVASPADAAAEQFVDVPADSIFAGDIERLADADVTRGCNPPDNDRFCPDDPVTRQQMAAFLVRAYGY